MRDGVQPAAATTRLIALAEDGNVAVRSSIPSFFILYNRAL
jgi:hypothetical protein